MGKVRSKYLMLEILAFASYGPRIGQMMFGTCRGFRKMIVINKTLVDSIIKSDIMEI